jgi:hypothetical protein
MEARKGPPFLSGGRNSTSNGSEVRLSGPVYGGMAARFWDCAGAGVWLQFK